MTNPTRPEPTITRHRGERLLTRRLLREVVPVSDMTIWRWERDDRFPRHLSLHGRNYWLYSEVEAWLASRRRGVQPGDNHG